MKSAVMMGWPEFLLIGIGAVILTVWNLGTTIDLSDPSTTIFHPFFLTGIMFLFLGILAMKVLR